MKGRDKRPYGLDRTLCVFLMFGIEFYLLNVIIVAYGFIVEKRNYHQG